MARPARPFVVGAVLGASVLPAAYVALPEARGAHRLGLDLVLTATPSGEVGLAGPPLLAQRPALQPGDRVAASRVVRNQTGRTLAVRVRAVPDSRDLDDRVQVRVTVDGLPVAAGSLGALRPWSARWFQLRRGERRRLAVEVVAGAGSRGRMSAVALELRARPRRG